MTLNMTAKEIVELACAMRDGHHCPAIGECIGDCADCWIAWFQSKEVK